MQIQVINNSNNMNFKAVNGFQYAGDFNPKNYSSHLEITKSFSESPAIKELAKKYNFIVEFSCRQINLPNVQEMYSPLYQYSIDLLPVSERYTEKTKQDTKSPIIKFFKNVFGKNEKKVTEQQFNEIPSNEEFCENLPKRFNFVSEMGNHEGEVVNKVINKLNKLSFIILGHAKPEK